jgi:hypothetical protein
MFSHVKYRKKTKKVNKNFNYLKKALRSSLRTITLVNLPFIMSIRVNGLAEYQEAQRKTRNAYGLFKYTFRDKNIAQVQHSYNEYSDELALAQTSFWLTTSYGNIKRGMHYLEKMKKRKVFS